MNLYKLSRAEHAPSAGIEEYEEAIVAAENEEKARHIHPCTEYPEDWYLYPNGRPPHWYPLESSEWVELSEVVVELIGSAKEGTPQGVITSIRY